MTPDLTMLYADYQPRLLAFVRCSGYNEQDAEDIVSETWTKLLTVLSRWDGQYSIRAILYGEAKHIMIDRYRYRRRYGIPEDLAAYEWSLILPDWRNDLERWIDLEMVWPTLTDKQQRSILAKVEGYSQTEAVILLGLTDKGAYRQRLFYGRRMLKNGISEGAG